LIGKLETTRLELGIDRRIILKWILERVGNSGLVGSYENGKEHSSFIKDGEFLD
jgi:hypothetical protein